MFKKKQRIKKSHHSSDFSFKLRLDQFEHVKICSLRILN